MEEHILKTFKIQDFFKGYRGLHLKGIIIDIASVKPVYNNNQLTKRCFLTLQEG
jgi:hypothetical protein